MAHPAALAPRFHASDTMAYPKIKFLDGPAGAFWNAVLQKLRPGRFFVKECDF